MILQVNSVTKRFGDFTALDKVSIHVPENSIFGLLGPNGAGKTTLIRIINQITGPDEGEVIFDGRKLHPDHISMIGYLPEERGLYKKMKVGEQALYLAQLKGLSHHDARQRLKKWFEKFEIQGWWDKKVEELSKGMQQKIQFVVTVVHEPKLLIFDEPFSGFDPINVNLLRDEILELRKNGSTIIFSTHNMASVEELCDNIALINKAKKILDGPVKEIKRKYFTNSYHVQYQDVNGKPYQLNEPGFEILESSLQDDVCTASFRLPADKGPNDLLAALLPNVSLISFNEMIPSMNDIFISTVNSVNANLIQES
ncbi:MAG: ABC transporter ATP-binding protein [Bacteroidota bacterium]